MQFPCRSSISTVVLIISFLNCFSTKVSSIDTLRQEPDNLNSSSQLVSANGDFTLGFYTPPNTNNTYLALWLTNTSYFNLVWIANRDNPIPSNASPVLRIGTGGAMTITLDDDVEPIELYGGGSRDRKNVTATLLDSGNFVVSSNESSGDVLWQSFDHPTDTLLPGMKIGVNYRTGRNWKFCSWLGSSNPVSGPFTLEWNPAARNLVFRQRESVYWRGGELKYYYDEFGKARVDFEFFNFRHDAENFNFNFTRITNDDEDYLVFSLVPIPNLNKKVVSGWKLNYEGDIYDIDRSVAVARPSVCLNYYTDESAASRACQKQSNCRNERQHFVLKSGDFKQQAVQFHDRNPSLSLNDCMQACWSSCKCVAYAGGNGTGCYAWSGKNLEFVPSDNASSSAQMYVLEMRSSSNKGMKKQMIVIILVVVGSVVLLILVITLFVLRKRRLRKRDEQLHDLLTLDGYTETYELENGGGKAHDLKLFSYASISSATNGFSSENILGQGGFGPVYKGKTSEGQDIAVKLLSRQSGQGIVELKTELILISKLQHVNLVKLIGCCIHGEDKMIVYEYMRNRSLDSFLFDPSKREQLDWPKRFNIIEGTAQGLLYLHKYSRLKIIHRDLKPNNILLDQNMNPKISDFGLARIFKQNAVEANTKRCYGTYGYMAPEYGMQGIFSVKSDIYSFGVLVLEIVTGRKNNSFHQMEGPVNLVAYAWDLWCKDSSVELMDPTLRNSCVMEQVQRCIHIGLLCVENHAVDRPTIEDVISMLRNETKDLAMPKSPAFITRNSVFEEASANEVTVSILQGR